MLNLVGDFETIRRGEDMSVWLFDLCCVETLEHETHTDIESGLLSISEDATIYFHNLKFDGSYLLDYFCRSGYVWKDSPREVKTAGEMYFLITDSGVWFMGKVILKNGRRLDFRDSFKKIPLSVRTIGESYKLPILKGEIDYTMPRPVGYTPTDEEIAYIHNDTEIVARALKIHFDEGLTELTAPADAFKFLKSTVCDSYRKLGIMSMRDKEHPEIDAFCRKAYCGGISWVNPDIKEKTVGAGVVYDVNSLYPSVMLNNPYPVYYPTKIQSYTELSGFLWIASFKVKAKRKPGKLPTLRANNAWVENSFTGVVTLTSVDYDLMLENYDVECDFIEGYRWAHSDDQLFTEFVTYWGNRKMQHTGGLRQIDKLMLNSCYGKFGLNPDRIQKRAVYDPITRTVKYPPYRDANNNKLVKHEKANNVAIAAFVTAYARRELCWGVNASRGFCYCDTDSVHLAEYTNELTGEHIKPEFNGEVHPTKLGAWKRESEFIRAKFLRQKTYIEEEPDGYLEVKACGMPQACKELVTWENFKIGAKFPGKLMPKVRPGGIELVESEFTIHETQLSFIR